MRLVRWVESDGSKHEREFPGARIASEFAVEMNTLDFVEAIALTLCVGGQPEIADVACQICGSITVYDHGMLRCMTCGATHDVPRRAIVTE